MSKKVQFYKLYMNKEIYYIDIINEIVAGQLVHQICPTCQILIFQENLKF